MRKIALLISASIVFLQWLIVGGFIGHSYVWWMKANDYQITAGVSAVVTMLVFTAIAIIYSAYFFVTSTPLARWWKVSSLIILCTGLTSQLVFWGMALSGVAILVHR